MSEDYFIDGHWTDRGIPQDEIFNSWNRLSPEAIKSIQEIGNKNIINLELNALVASFSKALLEKFEASEEKYKWNGGWKKNDWQEDFNKQFKNHVANGDPIDIAAYCAFAWYHKWSLSQNENQ